MTHMGADLQVRVEHSEGTPVVLVAGEIDMSTAPDSAAASRRSRPTPAASWSTSPR